MQGMNTQMRGQHQRRLFPQNSKDAGPEELAFPIANPKIVRAGGGYADQKPGSVGPQLKIGGDGAHPLQQDSDQSSINKGCPVSSGRRNVFAGPLWLASCSKAIKGGCGSMLLKWAGGVCFNKSGSKNSDTVAYRISRLVLQAALLLAGERRCSQVTGPCDVCTCWVCAHSVPLDCIWSRAWEAESGQISRTRPCIESLGGDFGGSPQQVTAGTRQGARTKTSATPAIPGPSQQLAPAAAVKHGDTMFSSGGRRAYTIRFRHHRKLPGLQDAGRTYLLRSSTSCLAGLRKHQVCNRLS